MEILFKRVYRFNLENLSVVPIEVEETENDFGGYLDQLIEDIIGDNRCKKYLFPDEQTAIKGVISRILDDHIDASTLDTANRLLRVEQAVQLRIERLEQEVQKGILLQSLVIHNNQRLYIITKSEHLDFISETDNRRAKGLPIKKKIFKSFCAYLDENNSPCYAMVGDSKQSISKYWWEAFLELREEYTDSYNTVKAFDTLDHKIFKKLKPIYQEDYMYLRNATVQYFRSNTEFVLQDYVEAVISNYQPADEDLQVDVLAERILVLPDANKFNSRFTIIRSELKKRIINKINLTPQLVLEIKENFDWNNTVRSFEEDGVKYILIRTDEGYEYFNKSTQNQN